MRLGAARPADNLAREDDMTPTISRHRAACDHCFPIGAHLVTPRLGYTHHGIYAGDGEVIHYEGLSASMRRGRVARVSLAAFGNGRPVCVHDEACAIYTGVEVAARALSRLGEDAYDLLRNNCEHFCAWCLSGAARSAQVERVLSDSRAIALAAQVLTVLVNLWGGALWRT